MIGHPLRGGVHAAGAVQDLERSRAAAGEGVGADARRVGLREAQRGRVSLHAASTVNFPSEVIEAGIRIEGEQQPYVTFILREDHEQRLCVISGQSV